ncbi:hypothetical protein [Tenggerimyces flavus]|uniref:Glycerophosphoryl diester phosphodiesterase membrane domain-containing protein n=1 Tax=Tenggerimyces flavus TaxID=1708749 RepID=A0ABV7YPI7_9ACTN|nr:hypothetical protein [Tenggerimyces flavus]MBM7786204.1 hypothetical protein [Tenggerimyces flavus]
MSEQPGQPEPGSTPGWAPPGGQPAWGTQPHPQQPPPPQQAPPQQPGGWGTQQPPPQPGGGWGTPPPPPPPHSGWGAPPPQPGGWGGQPGYGPPQAPKPGIVPLRPLGFGEILDGAFTTIQRYPKILLGLSALVMTVVTALGLVATFVGAGDIIAADPSQITQISDASWITFIVSILVVVLLSFVAGYALTGMVTATVGRGVLGQPMTVGEAWRSARPHILRLFGLGLLLSAIAIVGVAVITILVALAAYFELTWLAVLLGIVLGIGGIVLFVMFTTRMVCASAILVLETNPVDPNYPQGEQRKVGIVAAMKRSYGLVKGRSWRTFGLIFVAGLIAGVVSQILQIAFLLLGTMIGLAFGQTATGTAFTLAVSSVGAIGSAVIQLAFVAAVNAIIYVEARMRTEGLDIELTQATTPGYGQPTATPWVAR